jgi:hypothetical protein
MLLRPRFYFNAAIQIGVFYGVIDSVEGDTSKQLSTRHSIPSSSYQPLFSPMPGSSIPMQPSNI